MSALPTPVLPFDTALANGVHAIRHAAHAAAIRKALAHHTGVLRGYYYAGAVSPLVYQSARNTLIAEAEQRLGVHALEQALEEREHG